MTDEEKFIPRNYQVELMEIAIRQNTIIYLPTGSGKTFIAIMVLKYMSGSLSRPYSEGGKVSFILVNSVALAGQHSKYVKDHTVLRVGCYTGEMNLDFWKKDEWEEQFNKYQVFIMTSQILVNLINNNFIDLEKVNLIIFDECHRGVVDHSMRQVMKTFQYCDEQPRILGLTATLLNGNCKLNNVMNEVKSLETTYHSQVATVDGLEAVVGYSTNPQEKFKFCEAKNPSVVDMLVITSLKHAIETLNAIKFDMPVSNTNIPGNLKPLQPVDVLKSLKNLITDLIIHVKILGTFGGYKACLAHMIQVERIKKHCQETRLFLILNYVMTQMGWVKEMLKKAMENHSDHDKVYKFSSDKVLKLLEILEEYKTESQEELCCLIFVERRFTAKVIYHILRCLKTVNKNFEHIKSNFVVGNKNNPYNDTRENLFISKKNKEVLDSFINKEINVLVSSNVLEEGVDIPKCTLVIKFDKALDYRSYIQSKGRARHRSSLYYTIVEMEDLMKFFLKYKEFQDVETLLNDGPYMSNKKDAKRAAALQACIKLHKCGELDNDLLPLKKEFNEEDVSFLFEHFPADKENDAGNKKKKRLHNKETAACIRNKIEDNKPLYLHVIKLNPLYKRSEFFNQATVYDLYKTSLCFGLISSEPLPDLCKFPIFDSNGTVEVEIKMNVKELTLTNDEIVLLREFHYLIFNDLLEVLKPFLVFDNSGSNSEMLLVVPVQDESDVRIDFSVVLEHKTLKSKQLEPTSSERINIQVTEETYLHKIVSPWYRPQPSLYVVTRVCMDKVPSSSFPNQDYDSFVSYYEDKHSLKILNSTQPLLLVKGLSKRLNTFKPRGREGKRKKEKRYEELEEFLIPELVVKQDFPSCLWIQSRFLPSILSRVTYLLKLQQLQSQIAMEAALNPKYFQNCPPLELDLHLLHHIPNEMQLTEQPQTSESVTDNDCHPLDNPELLLTQQYNKDFAMKMLEAEYSWRNIEEPKDIEREIDVTVMDIEHYEMFISKRPSKQNLKKNLGGILKNSDLSPHDEWVPPCFCIPQVINSGISNKEHSVNSLFNCNIPPEEQISGHLSKRTISEMKMEEITEDEESSYANMCNFLNKQYVGDKTLADSVEALLGAFFQSGGIEDKKATIENINIHIPQWEEFENRLGYHFKNRGFLLQALTHSSYSPNRITHNYERLEFLGDAILDFLITCYIYEHCGYLTPGQVTDLRSALVNNNTFASLVVRCGFHKFLLMINFKLQGHIDKFAEYLAMKNYVIDDEVLILLEEQDLNIAEYIDVPKVLGDIFEALAGAVFLDSNKDLKTVWRVFYKIMWREIDLFSENVPKNVIRRLYECHTAYPRFNQARELDNKKTMICLKFMCEGREKHVHGFGTNKIMAKRAAAKLALRLLKM
ncbi:Dicer-2 [Asbolus verrucosus]|uniref:Dicer-2 n=1 Tax=Asbolus verrucosus TaxID=1661398 RepID=A0A482W843_ASBVE|nr:Dicer-2 [Asbolus verrucosus]